MLVRHLDLKRLSKVYIDQKNILMPTGSVGIMAKMMAATLSSSIWLDNRPDTCAQCVRNVFLIIVICVQSTRMLETDTYIIWQPVFSLLLLLLLLRCCPLTLKCFITPSPRFHSEVWIIYIYEFIFIIRPCHSLLDVSLSNQFLQASPRKWSDPFLIKAPY